MSRNSRVMLVVVVTQGAVTGCQQYDSLAPRRGGAAMGYLDHRGRQYQVRDLLDADYRAGSSDPFIRNFDPDTCFADRLPPKPTDRFEPGRVPHLLLRADRP